MALLPPVKPGTGTEVVPIMRRHSSTQSGRARSLRRRIHTFQVKSVVTTHQLVTGGFTDRDRTPVGAGTLSFEIGRGRVDAATPLSSLNGFQGIRRGVVRITDQAGGTSDVDLRAAVTVDGQPRGVTPVTVPLSRDTDHQVVLAADGYEPAHATLKRYLNPWLLGNVVFGGFLGLAVDVVSDSTHTLIPNILDVTLKPAAALPTGTPVGTPMPK